MPSLLPSALPRGSFSPFPEPDEGYDPEPGPSSGLDEGEADDAAAAAAVADDEVEDEAAEDAQWEETCESQVVSVILAGPAVPTDQPAASEDAAGENQGEVAGLVVPLETLLEAAEVPLHLLPICSAASTSSGAEDFYSFVSHEGDDDAHGRGRRRWRSGCRRGEQGGAGHHARLARDA